MSAMETGSHRLILSAFDSSFSIHRDAFAALGYQFESNVSFPDDEMLGNARLCLVNLYEAARHPVATLRLRHRLHRSRIPLIALDRDAPWHMGMQVRRLKLLEWIAAIDIYATHTMQPTYNFAPVKVYCPNAAWTRNFNLHGHTLEEMRSSDFFRWDVSFVGNMDGSRYREHAARQQFMNQLQPRLEALGLRVLFRSSSGMSETEQIEVIQRSIINLNYRSSCDQRSRRGVEMSWGLPERCYGVPARGGFMLSDERRHAKDDFDQELEWACYRDFEDCIDKICHYTGHFALTRSIAEAAHARVMREHTYERRAETLLKAADAWRARSSPVRT